MPILASLPEGSATAVCAHRAKGVGSFSFHVRLPASNKHASHNTCKTCASAFNNSIYACPRWHHGAASHRSSIQPIIASKLLKDELMYLIAEYACLYFIAKVYRHQQLSYAMNSVVRLFLTK